MTNLPSTETMERISRQELADNLDAVLDRVLRENIGLVITDEGNMFSPYFQLSYSEGDWMLEFEMDSETGDGYILGSITVEVDVPDGMRIEDVIVSIHATPSPTMTSTARRPSQESTSTTSRIRRRSTSPPSSSHLLIVRMDRYHASSPPCS